MPLNSSYIGVPARGGILPQTTEIDEFVANSLRYVIQHIFSNITNAFVVTISSKPESVVEAWFHDLMANLFATWGFMAVQLVLLDNKIPNFNSMVPGRRFCNMILVDSIDGLINTQIAQYNRNYDSLEYYFIFLQIRDAWMPPQRAKILQYCLDNYWLHCNVMIQNRKGEVLIYTYFPFRRSGCYQTEPVLINQFDGKRFVSDVMFPNKLRNFHNCPVKLSAWNIPPFVIYGPMENNEQQMFGLELSILRSIGQKLNFTLQFDTACNKNTTGDWAWKKLTDGQANITAGFLRRSTERDRAATPSYITYNLPLIPVIFRRVNHYKMMSILTFPLDKDTWIVLFFIVIALIVLNSIRTKFDTKLANNWHILESLLGVTTPLVPQNMSRRSIFISWILASFVLRALYQSRLFHLYRTHFYSSPPLSLLDIVESHYIAVSTRRTAQFLRNVPELWNTSLAVIELNTSNEMEPLSYIERNIDKNLVAISVVDFVYIYAAKELKQGNALIVVPAVINSHQIGFYFPKHSYFTERFNEWILRFHQAGVIQRWRSKSQASYKITVRTGGTTVLEKQLIIDMKQVVGFLSVIIMLDILAIIIFLLEIASTRLQLLQRMFKVSNGKKGMIENGRMCN